MLFIVFCLNFRGERRRGLIIYRWVSLLFYGNDPAILLEIVSDEVELGLALVLLPLPQLGKDKLEPILDGILRPPFQNLHQPAPLLLPRIFDDVRQQGEVLLLGPGPFLDGGVEEAGVVFSALFGMSVDLVRRISERVKLLRYELPFISGVRVLPECRVRYF